MRDIASDLDLAKVTGGAAGWLHPPDPDEQSHQSWLHPPDPDLQSHQSFLHPPDPEVAMKCGFRFWRRCPVR